MQGTPASVAGQPAIKRAASALVQEILLSERGVVAQLIESYSPVFILQEGARGKAPLFCVPGAGDSVASFISLCSRLDVSLPIYALQPRGMDNLGVPHSTVFSAADYYLNHMMAMGMVQPISLLGHSFGGWIAFEIAMKLLKNGTPPAALFILDSDPPNTDPLFIREYDNVEVFFKQIEIVELFVGRSLGIGRTDCEGLDHAGRRLLLSNLLIREGLLPKRSTPDALVGPLRTFARSLRTPYTPESAYPGPLQLIVVDDPRQDTIHNQQEHIGRLTAWKTWAPKTICSWVPGNHVTILREPHIEALATTLRPRLLGRGKDGHY